MFKADIDSKHSVISSANSVCTGSRVSCEISFGGGATSGSSDGVFKPLNLLKALFKQLW